MRQLMDGVELESRLKVWASWCLKNNQIHLGYPRGSLFAIMEDTGGLMPHLVKSYEGSIPINWVAEEIDRWVVKLAKAEPTLARALRVYYLDLGGCQSKARRIHLSYSTFRRYCDLGKYWILGGINETQIAA